MKVFFNEDIFISGEDWNPGSSEVIIEAILQLWHSLNCFNFHIDPTVYYSSSGLARLFANLEILDSLSDYSLTNPIDQLRRMLDDISAVNWNLNPRQKPDHNYYFLSGGGAISHYVNGTTVAEAAENKFLGEQVALLNLAPSQYNETNPIHINRSRINPPSEILICALTIIDTKDATVAFVKEHRKIRTFNWNPKHGENGKGMIANKGEVVSPLECSKEEAAQLLPEAVAFRKTSELYAFDTDRNKYIVFKAENTPDNKFHPYHPINQDEIPGEIKKFLNG